MLSEDRLLKLINIFWGLILLAMPVTSFRYFPAIFGRATVQPLSLYPLAILLLLFFVYLWKRKELPLPLQIVPLVAFLLGALCATVLGGTYAPLDVGPASYWERAFRACSTIGIGLAFFLAAFGVSYYQKSPQEALKKSLKWLYVGLVLTIIWGGIQAVSVNTGWISRSLIDELQLSFSQRPLLYKRVSGFAYEPAWLGDSLVILYFSWLVASIITGFRVSRYKWLEPVLAVASFALLLTTLSRGGVINAILTGSIVFIFAGFDRIKKGFSWFMAPFRNPDQRGKWLRFGIVLAILIFISIGFWFLNNSIFSTLWSQGLKGGLFDYLLANRLGSRLGYSYSGLKTFSLHPWTGVGLGASGFYMMDNYPDWIFSVPAIEQANQFGERFRFFPNPKNMYVRLLAETGLVGFWLYMALLFSMFGSLYERLSKGDFNSRLIGSAGLFGWIAVILSYVTQDSFALPFAWVILGMCLGFDRSLSLQQRKEGGGTLGR
jgi:hypothetical protein